LGQSAPDSVRWVSGCHGGIEQEPGLGAERVDLNHIEIRAANAMKVKCLHGYAQASLSD
jgi:hypothetical protein